MYFIGNFAEQYNMRRENHLSSLQQKEEEMRQKFVIRVKEKEAELKEAEKEVRISRIFPVKFNFMKKNFREIKFHEFFLQYLGDLRRHKKCEMNNSISHPFLILYTFIIGINKLCKYNANYLGYTYSCCVLT